MIVARRVARAALVTMMLVAACEAARAAGALAIGACGAYGQAFDYNDVTQARGDALHKCVGKDCRLVTTTQNNCAAFSIDAGNPCGPYGYAVAPRLGRAENDALRQCYKFGGRTCVIRAWACDNRG